MIFRARTLHVDREKATEVLSVRVMLAMRQPVFRAGRLDIATAKIHNVTGLSESCRIQINMNKSTITLFYKRSRDHRRNTRPIKFLNENTD
jgi:hypothetical protein